MTENNNYQYTIGEPSMQWSGFRLNMDYTISASITDEIIGYAIYSDKQCQGGIISDGEINSSLMQLSNDSVRISLLLNPRNIHGARYVSYEDDFAVIGVCVRLWIDKASSFSSPRDNYVMMQADINGLTGIMGILEDKSLNWGIDIFRCDAKFKEIMYPVPSVTNGERFRLCLRPTTRTSDDGVYLGLIESFRFERDNVIQNAVGTHGTDRVTKVTCHRGSDLCVIDSVLSNKFFRSSGEVMAEGSVYLQFGYQKKGKHRSLRRSVQVELGSSMKMRSLYGYEVGEIVGQKPAVHFVNIEPNNQVYSAEVFRCNNGNVPISNKKSLNEGEQLKICIQPDQRATSAGVYISAIESFSYGRANDVKTQVAVDSYGRVANDGKTQVECSRDVNKCFVETALEDWFFVDDASLVVTGYVILQFGAHKQHRRANIIYKDLEESDDAWRRDSDWFAGRSQITAYFDIAGNNNVDKQGPLDDWKLSATHMKIIYASAAVVFGLIWLCCLAGCFFLCCKNQEKREEPKSKRTIQLKIKVQGRDNSRSTDARMESNSFYDDYDFDKPENANDENPIPGYSLNDRIVEYEKKEKQASDKKGKKAKLKQKDLSIHKHVAKKKRGAERRNSKKNIDKNESRSRGQTHKDNSLAVADTSGSRKGLATIECSDEEVSTPRQDDVCFEAEEHPGTEAFQEAVQQTLYSLGPSSYTPVVYKNIKRQLSGRRFYVCDDYNDESDDESDDDSTSKKNEWREVTKRELIDLFRKYYEDKKSQML